MYYNRNHICTTTVTTNKLLLVVQPSSQPNQVLDCLFPENTHQCHALKRYEHHKKETFNVILTSWPSLGFFFDLFFPCVYMYVWVCVIVTTFIRENCIITASASLIIGLCLCGSLWQFFVDTQLHLFGSLSGRFHFICFLCVCAQ